MAVTMKPKAGFHDEADWTTTGQSLLMQIVFAEGVHSITARIDTGILSNCGTTCKYFPQPKKDLSMFPIMDKAIKFSSLPRLTDFFADMYMFWLEIYKRLCGWNLFEGKVWDEITYQFPNFNGCIPHNTMDVKLIHARIKVKP